MSRYVAFKGHFTCSVTVCQLVPVCRWCDRNLPTTSAGASCCCSVGRNKHQLTYSLTCGNRLTPYRHTVTIFNLWIQEETMSKLHSFRIAGWHWWDSGFLNWDAYLISWYVRNGMLMIALIIVLILITAVQFLTTNQSKSSRASTVAADTLHATHLKCHPHFPAWQT